MIFLSAERAANLLLLQVQFLGQSPVRFGVDLVGMRSQFVTCGLDGNEPQPVTRRVLVNKMRQRAEDQALRQRAFAEDMPASNDPRHEGSIHAPTRKPDIIEGEFEHRDK